MSVDLRKYDNDGTQCIVMADRTGKVNVVIYPDYLVIYTDKVGDRSSFPLTASFNTTVNAWALQGFHVIERYWV